MIHQRMALRRSRFFQFGAVSIALMSLACACSGQDEASRQRLSPSDSQDTPEAPSEESDSKALFTVDFESSIQSVLDGNPDEFAMFVLQTLERTLSEEQRTELASLIGPPVIPSEDWSLNPSVLPAIEALVSALDEIGDVPWKLPVGSVRRGLRVHSSVAGQHPCNAEVVGKANAAFKNFTALLIGASGGLLIVSQRPTLAGIGLVAVLTGVAIATASAQSQAWLILESAAFSSACAAEVREPRKEGEICNPSLSPSAACSVGLSCLHCERHVYAKCVNQYGLCCDGVLVTIYDSPRACCGAIGDQVYTCPGDFCRSCDADPPFCCI